MLKAHMQAVAVVGAKQRCMYADFGRSCDCFLVAAHFLAFCTKIVAIVERLSAATST